MNISEYAEIHKRFTKIEASIKSLSRSIAALKIDKQLVLQTPSPIKPGKACKVTYDQNGLITSNLPLLPQDIPELPINKINGLSEALNSKASNNELEKIRNVMKNSFKKGSTVKTGTKVNIDSNGFITELNDLIEEDIPELNIDKIKGLRQKLELIENTNREYEPEKISKGGIGIKVKYDEYGRVVNSTGLSIDDIPPEVINRINLIETNITNFATNTAVDTLRKLVNKKVDANTKIDSGVYTKVAVDSKGLVTKGYTKLNKTDLPELNVLDIKNLNTQLNAKADYDDLLSIREDINNIMHSFNSIPTLTQIDQLIEEKISGINNFALDSRVSEIEYMLERINNNDVSSELNSLESRMNEIESSVSRLESDVSHLI